MFTWKLHDLSIGTIKQVLNLKILTKGRFHKDLNSVHVVKSVIGQVIVNTTTVYLDF